MSRTTVTRTSILGVENLLQIRMAERRAKKCLSSPAISTSEVPSSMVAEKKLIGLAKALGFPNFDS